MTEHATFAAGCFWGIEDAFSKVDGVVKATSGYTGGRKENPAYEEVCTGATGHAEAVLVEFDPETVSYTDLLSLFWDIHDPTQMNRQGPDFGTQYRSAIFTHTQAQKEAAETSKAEEQAAGHYFDDIVTEITPATTFYPAEEYHQKYFVKHGIKGH